MGRDGSIIFMGRPCTDDEIRAFWDRIRIQVIDSDEFDADSLGFWGLHEGMEQSLFRLDDNFPIVLHGYGISPISITTDTDSDEFMWFVVQKLLYCGEENNCIDPKDIPTPHDDRFKLWVLSDFSV